jgi:hypothetical protein
VWSSEMNPSRPWMPRSLSPKDSQGSWDSFYVVPKFGDFRESSNFLLVSAAIRIVRRLV